MQTDCHHFWFASLAFAVQDIERILQMFSEIAWRTPAVRRAELEIVTIVAEDVNIRANSWNEECTYVYGIMSIPPGEA